MRHSSIERERERESKDFFFLAYYLLKHKHIFFPIYSAGGILPAGNIFVTFHGFLCSGLFFVHLSQVVFFLSFLKILNLRDLVKCVSFDFLNDDDNDDLLWFLWDFKENT